MKNLILGLLLLLLFTQCTKTGELNSDIPLISRTCYGLSSTEIIYVATNHNNYIDEMYGDFNCLATDYEAELERVLRDLAEEEDLAKTKQIGL